MLHKSYALNYSGIVTKVINIITEDGATCVKTPKEIHTAAVHKN